MRKLFTLIVLMVCAIGSAWAGDVFTLTLNKSVTQSTDGYFTVAKTGGTVSFSTNYTGTYGGVSYDKTLKMESATYISFTSTSTSTVTIVQSLKKNDGKYIKFDESAKSASDRVDDATNNVGVYTITNVAAGSHKITRNDSEIGILYVKVEYTGTVIPQLGTPAITFDATTGAVTITPAATGDNVYYTTDGTTPTASSTKYTAPFNVTDGTTVNAIAIGDGTTSSDSKVATQLVLLSGITIATPTISTYNGTVGISCTSPSSTIEYSTDGGTTYTTYVRPFTLAADATVKARASRTGCTTSEVASEAITTVQKNANAKTIYFGYESFGAPAKVDGGYSTLTGKTGTDAEGYTLVLSGNANKDWSSGNNAINYDATNSLSSIKLSNGAQNKMTLPAGVKATRVTFYSYVNAGTSTTNCYWKEIAGTNIDANVPMGAFTDVTDFATNPDVRVFPLNDVTGSFTFNNAGTQFCFIIALDVVQTQGSFTITDDAGYATYFTDKEFTMPTGVTGYTVTAGGETLTYGNTYAAGSTVPASTALLLQGTKGTYTYDITSTGAAAPINNLLVGSTTETTESNDNYKFYTLQRSKDNAKVGFFYAVEGGHSVTSAANKCYLRISNGAAAENYIFDNTTGIHQTDTNATQTNAKIFNLNGQYVGTSLDHQLKGVYIQNGKKVVIK